MYIYILTIIHTYIQSFDDMIYWSPNRWNRVGAGFFQMLYAQPLSRATHPAWSNFPPKKLLEWLVAASILFLVMLWLRCLISINFSMRIPLKKLTAKSFLTNARFPSFHGVASSQFHENRRPWSVRKLFAVPTAQVRCRRYESLWVLRNKSQTFVGPIPFALSWSFCAKDLVGVQESCQSRCFWLQPS